MGLSTLYWLTMNLSSPFWTGVGLVKGTTNYCLPLSGFFFSSFSGFLRRHSNNPGLHEGPGHVN